jgi:hypothetical protein
MAQQWADFSKRSSNRQEHRDTDERRLIFTDVNRTPQLRPIPPFS